MFRDMRRKDREMSKDQAVEIMKNSDYGILSTLGEDGYPYGIALNYTYFNENIYFHCAKEGHKLDNIKNNNKVSFCIVSEAEVVKEKFSTKYKSVVLFGKAEEVLGDEKSDILLEIIKKYSLEFFESGKRYVENSKNATKIYKINIEYYTGKSNS